MARILLAQEFRSAIANHLDLSFMVTLHRVLFCKSQSVCVGTIRGSFDRRTDFTWPDFDYTRGRWLLDVRYRTNEFCGRSASAGV